MRSLFPLGAVLGAAALVSLVGCAEMMPDGNTDPVDNTFPVQFDLESNGIGDFDVEAGTPRQKLAMFTVNTGGINVGDGFIEIEPNSITVTPADETTKGSVSAQTVNCVDACAAASVDAATCTNVCDNNVIQLKLVIGDFEAIQADCDDGDVYNFTIALDDDSNVTGIVADPDSFIGNTVMQINSGEFGACFEAIAPFTGDVLISEMVVNVAP